MEDLRFPDPKAIVVAALKDLGVPVSTRVPKVRPAAFAIVQLASGAGQIIPALEEVGITLDVWDNDEMQARSTMERARSILRRTRTVNGEPIYAYNEWGAPVDLPDESGQPRYTLTFSIRLRSTAV